MLAYREWRCRVEGDSLKPILQSTHQPTLWHEAAITADAVPAAGESLGAAHGIHAVDAKHPGDNRFLTNLGSLPRRYQGGYQPHIMVQGAVDLWGTLQVHTDGVIRAEHCRILAIRLVTFSGPNTCICGEVGVVAESAQGGAWKYRILCTDGDHHSYLLKEEGTRPTQYTTVQAIEHSLLARYEVYRLPLSEGPWPR